MHTVSCYHFCFLLHWPGEAIHMWPHHITPCSMFYYNHNCFAFHLSRLQKVPSRVKILETWTRPALMGAVFAMAWFNSLMSSILIQNDPSLHFTCPGCRRFQAKSRSWRRGQGLNWWVPIPTFQRHMPYPDQWREYPDQWLPYPDHWWEYPDHWLPYPDQQVLTFFDIYIYIASWTCSLNSMFWVPSWFTMIDCHISLVQAAAGSKPSQGIGDVDKDWIDGCNSKCSLPWKDIHEPDWYSCQLYFVCEFQFCRFLFFSFSKPSKKKASWVMFTSDTDRT